MKARDSLEGLRDFWKEFVKVKTGLVGLAILLAFVALAIFAVLHLAMNLVSGWPWWKF